MMNADMRLVEFLDRFSAICNKRLLISKTATGKVTLPLRPILVGSKLKHWNQFNAVIRKTLEAENKSLGNLPGLTLDEAALEDALATKLKIRGERSLRGLAKLAFEDPCAAVMSQVAKLDRPLSFEDRYSGPGMDIGNADRVLGFPTDISGKPNPWTRLPIVYKPPWEVSLNDVFTDFNQTRFDPDNKLVKSVNQLGAYMTYNNVKYGILSTVKSAVAFRVMQVPSIKGFGSFRPFETSIEVSTPMHWQEEGLNSPLGMYIYLAMLSYQNTVPRREYLELRLRTKKKLLHNLPGITERDIENLTFRLDRPMVKKRGNVIRGTMSEIGKHFLVPAVFKLYDLSTREGERGFRHESAMYEKLAEVQGRAVPRMYFSVPNRGVMGIIALEDCGEPLTEWTPETLEHARLSLEDVHKHDVLHQDIAMHNFVYQPGSKFPVRLVGFGGAKEREFEGPEVLLDEMGQFMRLATQQLGKPGPMGPNGLIAAAAATAGS
ncbi:hypothetical protein Dda_6791 [Drechslerella dactyloides]|uniref:Protein kinase domain-containing protein n=1 Tax=Drechslerella dactyloides TaxID=74499 RepID=A0AAD6IVI6_DREDA|nr:hypothetical protein Dda_6791 [Drechslerella dactyloides]